MLKTTSRRTYSVLFLSLLVLSLTACDNKAEHRKAEDKLNSAAQPSTGFTHSLFNEEWLFFRADAPMSLAQVAKVEDWDAVELPHTTKIEPLVVNDQWQGEAWYKKTFSSDRTWQDKRVYLDFEGAMNVADVYLNGQHLVTHLGGYLPFTAELTSQLVEGENTLLVRLDNTDNPITGPKPLKTLDFNTYGGIYRNSWLRVENATHITNAVAANEVAGGGIFVQYPQVTQEQATLDVKTHLNIGSNTKKLTVVHTLYFDDEEIITPRETFSAPSDKSMYSSQTIVLAKPKLWSPKHANLYTLKTDIYADELMVDSESIKIGIREFTFTDNDLYINGEKSFLRGVNRHQEYPYIGYALSDAAQYRDAEKIKAAGFDYVRLSHYPHATAFMRAADELGLVVIDAILGWQYVGEHPQFTDHVVQTCRDMIRRDRNHPSVLAWECSLNESRMEESLIDRFQTAVHEEYPGAHVFSAGWQDYGYDIYLQARQHRLKHYETPAKPYVVSEYGDWEYYAMNAGLNQDSWGDLLQADRSSRQLLADGEKRLQQQAFNIKEAHNDNFNTPAFADGYWVMFDYNRGYANDLEASGIMSIHRRPKFSYYFFQSQRSANHDGGPLAKGYMAHIASHWMEDSNLSFYVYSNAQTVTLMLNGKKVADAKPDNRFKHLAHPPFYFSVPKFEAGKLEALAYVDGKLVASNSVQTPSSPAKLSLSLEHTSLPPQVGVNDSVFVYATLLDERGVPTHVNNINIVFSVEGDIRMVSPAAVSTEDGVASALIRVGDSLKGAKLTASVTLGNQVSVAELAL